VTSITPLQQPYAKVTPKVLSFQDEVEEFVSLMIVESVYAPGKLFNVLGSFVGWTFFGCHYPGHWSTGGACLGLVRQRFAFLPFSPIRTGVLIVSLFHAFEALSSFSGMSDLLFSFQISREFGSINFHWYGLVLLLSSSELL
jgi:hypothetical protein